ncbi:ATP-dependent helicase [Pediococcus acidilactici]|uniref:DNA 3'-5' helicase n=1 Tax=Pediococcus acidilactici TaxID=1254 RepID=A0AAW8YKM4_PEDAC|nr:ATP-dependent helicase [Pediococcus acidilactici]MDV2622116.1 ATP-dependent helicase [Pediococcus acidilactici]NBI15959.1 ATP-dependent helicase [Pediococcus acidilactici]NFA46516.1 ATP-dependent helicase [Pediococcus acidilactici]NFA46983.1 ATP-dependent helicase [Pediococcus acidilactici]NFA89101.1 ATP-dependent helicase [Pediococcus acidilactici]
MIKEVWNPRNGIKLEKNAKKAVFSEENTLILAGPGAGKTEMLAQRASYLLETGKCQNPYRILAISFKRDAASNLKERVKERTEKKNNIRLDSITFDSFSKRLVDQFIMAIPLKWRPPKGYTIEDSEIKETIYKNIEKPVYKYSRTTINNFFDKIKKPTLEEEPDGVWQLSLKGTENLKPNLTFKMINQLAIFLLQTNPNIKRLIQNAYPFVFLDEFQDTTALQYELITECFKDTTTVITAVGDTKQRIMGWAGALKTIFKDFKRDFSANELSLKMNHRSAPALVKLQESVCFLLEEGIENIRTSEKWGKEDGEIKLFKSTSEENEAQLVGDDILKRLSKGLRPEDIVILCKQKPDVYTKCLKNYLEEKDVQIRVEDPYQSLLKEPVVDLILKTISAADNTLESKEWQEYIDIVCKIKQITTSENDRQFGECLKSLNLFLKSFKKKLTGALDSEQVKKIKNEIMSYFKTESIQEAFPEYRNKSYLDRQLENFCDLIIKTKDNATNWQDIIDNFKGKNTISIMTIHKSKGLEYEAVYFVGLEDQAFWNFKKQRDEDIRAFFVAISRAKRILACTFCQKRNIDKVKRRHDEIRELYKLLDDNAEFICD